LVDAASEDEELQREIENFCSNANYFPFRQFIVIEREKAGGTTTNTTGKLH